MKLYRSIFLASALAVFSFEASAQDFNKIFEDFVKSNQQEFESFRERANREYAEFMRKGWEWFEGKEPVAPPVQEEPVVPPVVVPEEDRDKDREETEIPYGEVVPEPEPVPAPMPIEPVEDVPAPVVNTLSFELYGTDCMVRFDMDKRPFLSNVSENSIADLWEAFVAYDGLDNMLYDMYSQREGLGLCDWAYYKYVKSFCHTLYPDNPAEAGVLHAFILTQSGFKLKIGVDNSGCVYPLMAIECDLYSYPYFELDGNNYYVLEENSPQSMKILEDGFPATMHPMRISMETENLFAEALSPTRTLASKRYPGASVSVASNLNLIEFFNDYPLAFVNNDMRTKWRFYANVPASHNIRETVYPALRRAIAGKSELDAANILLNFVQTAFEYEYDDEIWGGDRSFFADESIYYPYCDCEDRSILFSRLVRDLMGLDVVLIYYPGHLASAVKFTEDVTGDYIIYDNSRYTICDPTYINAPVGMTMPDMDNATAFVVVL